MFWKLPSSVIGQGQVLQASVKRSVRLSHDIQPNFVCFKFTDTILKNDNARGGLIVILQSVLLDLAWIHRSVNHVEINNATTNRVPTLLPLCEHLEAFTRKPYGFDGTESEL